MEPSGAPISEEVTEVTEKSSAQVNPEPVVSTASASASAAAPVAEVFRRVRATTDKGQKRRSTVYSYFLEIVPPRKVGAAVTGTHVCRLCNSSGKERGVLVCLGRTAQSTSNMKAHLVQHHKDVFKGEELPLLPYPVTPGLERSFFQPRPAPQPLDRSDTTTLIALMCGDVNVPITSLLHSPYFLRILSKVDNGQYKVPSYRAVSCFSLLCFTFSVPLSAFFFFFCAPRSECHRSNVVFPFGTGSFHHEAA